MSRKSLTLIVGMSLALVFITTQTLILTSFSNNQRNEEKLQELELGLEMSQEEPLVEGQILPEESTLEEQPEEDGNKENQPIEVEESNNKSEPEKPVTKPSNSTPTIVREDKRLNSETANTNILCLGIADEKLEMISIYSINKDNKKSAGIFLPTRISLRINGELLSLRDIYNKYGVLTLKKAISQSMLVDIPYHMVADKNGLIELSELIGPLYVENEEIDIPNLFVRPTSEKDDAILQSLANEVTKPKMVLQLPKLIKIFINNVQSDIGISGLWELYQVFSKLDHSELSKIVLWGKKVQMSGRDYWFIAPYDWHNVVYEMTS